MKTLILGIVLTIQPVKKASEIPVEKKEVVLVEKSLDQMVLITHDTFVTGDEMDEINRVSLLTQSVGWLVSLEPRVVIAQRRWQDQYYGLLTMSPDMVHKVEVLNGNTTTNPGD